MILDNLCNLHNTKVIHAMFEDHLQKKNWTSRLDMNPGVDMLSRLSSIPPAYSHASATTTTIKKPFAFHYITAVISGTHPENMHLLNFLKILPQQLFCTAGRATTICEFKNCNCFQTHVKIFSLFI